MFLLIKNNVFLSMTSIGIVTLFLGLFVATTADGTSYYYGTKRFILWYCKHNILFNKIGIDLMVISTVCMLIGGFGLDIGLK